MGLHLHQPSASRRWRMSCFFDSGEFSLTNPFYFRVSSFCISPSLPRILSFSFSGFINQRSSLFEPPYSKFRSDIQVPESRSDDGDVATDTPSATQQRSTSGVRLYLASGKESGQLAGPRNDGRGSRSTTKAADNEETQPARSYSNQFQEPHRQKQEILWKSNDDEPWQAPSFSRPLSFYILRSE